MASNAIHNSIFKCTSLNFQSKHEIVKKSICVDTKTSEFFSTAFSQKSLNPYFPRKQKISRDSSFLKLRANLSETNKAPVSPATEENGNAIKNLETVPLTTSTTIATAPIASSTEIDIVDEEVEKKIFSFSEIGEFFDFEKPSAIATTLFWVASAFIFGSGVGVFLGSEKATEFFAGYLLEQSLSVDNLFVFVLIFNYFQVPAEYQGRVLTYGIAGAIVFRAIMIILGVATIQKFEAVNLLFAGILIYSSYRLLAETEEEEDDLSKNSIVNFCKKLIPVTNEYDGNKFYTVIDGARKATPLLLTLAIVELSDVAFAVDSIPAVFGVTRDPFIVFSSNIFAILGLRSLYTVISGSMKELHFLQPSIAIVLGFIGSKMVIDLLGIHVPTEMSLGVVAGVLGTGVFLSLRYPKSESQ